MCIKFHLKRSRIYISICNLLWYQYTEKNELFSVIC
jgi:hypothetical protein